MRVIRWEHARLQEQKAQMEAQAREQKAQMEAQAREQKVQSEKSQANEQLFKGLKAKIAQLSDVAHAALMSGQNIRFTGLHHRCGGFGQQFTLLGILVFSFKSVFVLS